MGILYPIHSVLLCSLEDMQVLQRKFLIHPEDVAHIHLLSASFSIPTINATDIGFEVIGCHALTKLTLIAL